MYDNLDSLEGNLSVQGASRDFLTETAKWARFLGILGYILAGFILVVGIILLPAIFSETNPDSISASDPIKMIVSALLYGIPCRYLLKFSKHTKSALARNSSTELNNAFGSLKSAHKFFGIVTIITIALYALMLLLFVVIGSDIGFF